MISINKETFLTLEEMTDTKILFMEVFSEPNADSDVQVPLETVIALFVYNYCDCPPSIQLSFVLTENTNKDLFTVTIPKSVLFTITPRHKVSEVARSCKLPLIVEEEYSGVAGLCAVLRQIIKTSNPVHPLLGFKQSCLYACAESSIWTKYCEIDIINTVKSVVGITVTEVVQIPIDVVRFETHLAQPVRIHNIQKQKQNYAKALGESNPKLPDSRLGLVKDLEHLYAEGPELSLADIILYPCFRVIVETLHSVYLKENLPLVYKWYERLSESCQIEKSLLGFKGFSRKFANELYVRYEVPVVLNQSMYKSDPKRYKPQKRIYTKQDDVEKSLGIVQDMSLNFEWDDAPFGRDVEFDWGAVPLDAQPEGGHLPQNRILRKSQQLQNLAKAVLKIAKPGDRIIDFCAGSGHLGLILAHFLPRCTIIFLENKEESIGRARARAKNLRLKNVLFYQSNLDYYCGEFDVGVSLHACGVATDLVMERCLQQNASFVCCPCCYGSIQDNHILQYPRSQRFRDSILTVREYLVLGHASDQTHDVENAKTEQGHVCMDVIDTDRGLKAKESNYFVSLSKLYPPSCTPKNNLLVGIPNQNLIK